MLAIEQPRSRDPSPLRARQIRMVERGGAAQTSQEGSTFDETEETDTEGSLFVREPNEGDGALLRNGAPLVGGTLYFVSTPIGNLEDVTLRAIRTLSEADVIASEDTRVTAALLRHLGIGRKHLVSHHEHNLGRSIPVLLRALADNQVIRARASSSLALLNHSCPADDSARL